MKIHLTRSPFGLSPATDEDREKLKLLFQKEGYDEVYEIDVRVSRNYRFHCKYMKLFRIAWEYQNEDTHSFFGNMDNWRESIETSVGCCKFEYSLERNEWLPRHKSISFENMEEKDFQDLYERVKYKLFSKWLPEGVEDDFFEALRDF